MKTFTADWLARLNAQQGGGVFFFAVDLTVDVGDVRYYADAQHAVSFDGNTYAPLPLLVEGLGQTSQQSLPAIRVTTSNVTGDVGAFLETTDLLGHDLVVRLLHMDLLGSTSNQDQAVLQIVSCDWDDQQATITAGLNIGLQDILPRGLISAAEFPGMPEGLRRASIL